MRTSRVLSMAVASCLPWVPSASRAAEGAAEWQRVDQAIASMKGQSRASSRDEAVAQLKKGLTEFDAAYAAAMKAAPRHPNRWDAALFLAMTSRAREMAGLPQPANPVPLSDIVAAADAKPETRAQASVVDLMQSAAAAEAPGGDTATWVARAKKHLQQFPGEGMNRLVESRIKSFEAIAGLKAKPLDLKFTAVDGREVDLAKLRGKVVLIDFWATWCGPCVAEIPNLRKTYKEYHPKGFEIVGISLDSNKGTLESFVKEKGMDWPQHFDGKGWQNEISSRFGVNSIPAMWLVGKDGMVVSFNVRGKLEESLSRLLTR